MMLPILKSAIPIVTRRVSLDTAPGASEESEVPAARPGRYASGEMHSYLGKMHRLEVQRGQEAACHLRVPKDIPLPVLRIRSMKTRWGSFSPEGRVTLNLGLITMSVDYLDYVILHELCHSRIKRHGPRFWNLLETFLPDCKERTS